MLLCRKGLDHLYYHFLAFDNKICFRGDAEELLDSDISHEFFRESHHIHSIPRPQVDEVSIYLSVRKVIIHSLLRAEYLPSFVHLCVFYTWIVTWWSNYQFVLSCVSCCLGTLLFYTFLSSFLSFSYSGDIDRKLFASPALPLNRGGAMPRNLDSPASLQHGHKGRAFFLQSRDRQTVE